jgi:hypothetical protein
MKYKLRFIKVSLGLLLMLLSSFSFKPKTEEVKHKIQVIHPGKHMDQPIESILVEKLKKNGETLEFLINVESVICTNNTCKIVPVNIYWDKFGAYNRIELEKGDYLEKLDGEEFSKREYRKLDKILKNKKSVLANYNIDEILVADKATESEEKLKNIDAVSGATILSIPDMETIKGATLTCYTLWHWVNGDVSKRIKEIALHKPV